MEPVKHGTDEMSSTSRQPLPHNEFRRTVSAAVPPIPRHPTSCLPTRLRNPYDCPHAVPPPTKNSTPPPTAGPGVSTNATVASTTAAGENRYPLTGTVAELPTPIESSMANRRRKNSNRPAALGFEAQLWVTADKLRGHMDASEYKHVVLGLIFLKYISDAFEEKREQLLFGFADPKSEWFIKDEPERAEAAENRDEYLAARVFWLPKEARWNNINAKAKSPQIGKVIDDAMGAIEGENPTLKGVLPRDYARPSLDKVRLGGRGRRRRTVRAKDKTPHHNARNPVRGIGEAGEGHPPKLKLPEPCLNAGKM
jgi:HsdM N-terminal domain